MRRLPRAAVREVIIDELEGVVPSERIFATGDIDTPQGSTPFIVVKWLDATKSFVAHGSARFDVWVYDPQKTLSRIDDIVSRLINAFINVEHHLGLDGVPLTQVDWLTTTQDLYDDVFKAQLKRATFSIPTS